jgi:hypothetical protein
LKLQEPVVYDASSGTCDFAQLSGKTFAVDLGPSAISDEEAPRLYLVCEGVAPSDIAQLRFKILLRTVEILSGKWKCTGSAFKVSNDFDLAVPKIETHCTKVPESGFEGFEEKFRENCESAGGFEGEKPIFTSSRVG